MLYVRQLADESRSMAKVSSRKKNVEINLEQIGQIVSNHMEKQNNRLMAAMIISLEDQKKI
jgi:hypothetical protein